MNDSTWRAFCKAAGDQKNGYVMNASRPVEEHRFKCTLCGMEFTTGIKLDGMWHKAILNKCGGIWRLMVPVGGEATAKAVVGNPEPTPHREGE